MLSNDQLLKFILAFILGSSLASFSMWNIERILNGRSIAVTRSHCDSCKKVLRWYELIPVVSYILFCGKCKTCHNKIPFRYFLGELLMGILAVLCALKYQNLIVYFSILVWIYVLFEISYMDFLSYTFLELSLIIGFLNWIFLMWYLNVKYLWVIEAMLVACIIPFILILITLWFKKTKNKIVMGNGDFKLLYLCGLYCFWPQHVYHLLLSCVIGLIFSMAFQKKKIPFAPSICIAEIFMLFIMN